MPRPARQRQTPTRADVRRDELVSQLIDVFLRDGFAEQSLEELAGTLRCSKSTLYLIAASKEQVILTTIRRFFRRAAGRVESALHDDPSPPRGRIHAYLMAISRELALASPAFYADIDAMPAARDIYRENTQIAADRLQELVREEVPAVSRQHAVFVGAIAAHAMEAIQRGEIEVATGMPDSDAYRALADLIVAGLASAS